MARGATAKESVEKKIIEVFGNDYVGTSDKKIYVWADDGGEKVQIAISFTCPKTFLVEDTKTTSTAAPTPAVTGDTPPWEEDPVPVVTETPTKPDQKEIDNLAEMMAKFGL